MQKNQKFTALIALAALWAACAGARPAAAARESVEPVFAEASVALSTADAQASAGAAITEAQRNAVSAVADLFLDPAAKAEKHEIVSQNLLKSPQAFVVKQKVLYQGAEGAFYRVKLRAHISIDKVSAAVRNLSLGAQPGGSRRTALLAGEYFNGRPSAASDFSGAFTGWFKGRDSLVFTGVSAPGGWTPALTWPEESGLPAGEADAQKAFFEAAGAAGAGLVLVGRAEARPLSASQNLQPGFYPARAEARFRLYDASGKQLLEASSQANSLDAAEETAFKKALVSAGELLAQDIAGRVERILKPEAPVTLRVLGLSGIEAAHKLKAAVERLDINGAAFESYAGGAAVMKVALKRPDPEEFASALLRVGVFPMDLESVSQQEVVFALR